MNEPTKQPSSALNSRIMDFRRAVLNHDGAKLADMLQDLKHRIEKTEGTSEARRAAVMIASDENIPAAYERYDRQQTKAEDEFHKAAEVHRHAGLEAQAEDLKYDLYPSLADMEPHPTNSRAARMAELADSMNAAPEGPELEHPGPQR